MYVIIYTYNFIGRYLLNICHNKNLNTQELWFFQYVIIFLQVNF